MNLTKQQKEYITTLIKEGKELPQEFKYLLFPSSQKEYELTYAGKMRKEDILANEDGVFPVPLQIEKTFNGGEYEEYNDGWKNMLVFGDNLQFLKTIYKNEDPLIKDKVKGKVKLIYIDPPFATTDEFQNKEGAKAYTDKKKGAEFVEFLRKRLIVAREILADDGSIYVHLDNKMVHYIKILMDEIFGKQNFIREVIWNRGNPSGGKAAANNWIHTHDTILFYSRNKDFKIFNKLYEPYSQEYIDKRFIHKDKIDRYRLQGSNNRKQYLKDSKGKAMTSVWNISNINVMALEKTGYPTQKPEALINQIIKASSNKDDIVFDFFGGSGVTASVAERLGRKWITCDLGKLSFFTMQKRILQIQNSKDLENPKKKYNKKAKSFITAQLGMYDLKKALELEWQKYQEFVASLFEIELKKHKIAGLEFDGKKRDYSVKIFDFKKFKDSTVDEEYIEQLHSTVGKKVSGKVYIIAPANYVEFLTDYYEIDSTRYYFLKIPYHVIKELHQKPFQKLRQPQSKKNVNDLDEAIGFHFKRPPEVKSEIKIEKDNITLFVKSFISRELESDKDQDEKGMKNFETLSAIFIDKNYNGKSFEMDEALFADDLLPKKSNKKDIENLKDELKKLQTKGLEIKIENKDSAQQIMVVYTDIYGNDFTETFKIDG